MKIRIFTILMLLASIGSKAQYFNDHIARYGFNCVSTQTITHDIAGDVTFISIDPFLNQDIQIVTLDQAGNYKLTKRIVNSKADTLIPQNGTFYIRGTIKS